MIKRELEAEIKKRIGRGKTVIVLGARQVGKTTLLHHIYDDDMNVLWMNADEMHVRSVFENLTAASFKPFLSKNRTVIIDEAQRIDNIGLKLKILQDAYGKDIQFIATGSSSFDLANKINEPMTGRKRELMMYPLKLSELVEHHGLLEEQGCFDTRLIYGFYPEVVEAPADAREILSGFVNDNLYKDIYKWEEIRKPVQFENLTKALAYQIGSQVSLNELGSHVGLDKNTVEKYIRLLEQSYIIFRIGSFSRNLRNELKASNKYYFYDIGIRNALIGNFSIPAERQDIGHIFENFAIAEMVKKKGPVREMVPGYFWRTTAGQEIDFVDEYDGKIFAYEIKFSDKRKPYFSKTFTEKYKPEKTIVLNSKNIFEVLLN